MAKYEKWLGAGLGVIITGSPLGGLLGFIAGTLVESNMPGTGNTSKINLSEFEINLMILASHLVKIDGKVSLTEVRFINNFLDKHFDDKYSDERSQVLNHCLQKEYDLTVACAQIRTNSQQGTRVQVVRFLFDLATCDGELTERENYFIFRIAGYLNVNDVEFRKIKKEHLEQNISFYDVLGVQKDADFAEIRSVYRKLVLKYHPDKNAGATDDEKKRIAQKFLQIQDAYTKIKAERGEN